MRREAVRPLSARDIAKAISGSEEGQSLVFERVRHWTREGLLPLTGDKHPGTGRKRLFGNDALAIARVLNELAEHGIGVRHPSFETAANLVRDSLEEIRVLIAQRVAVYLLIEYIEGHPSTRFAFKSQGTLPLLIEEKIKPRALEINPEATSTIVVNVSNLVK
jgi:hypothetical protein